MNALLGKLVELFVIFCVPMGMLNAWIGVLGYFFFGVFSPQFIWRGSVGGGYSKFLAVSIFAGFMVKATTGKIDFSILKQKQNIFVMLLWFFIVNSYVFSPYGHEVTIIPGKSSAGMDPGRLLSGFNKLYLIYFISLLCVDKRKHLYWMMIAFLFVILYYIYWANDKYLSGMMFTPRLPGPVAGPYFDENTFAMVFVTGSASLYFMGNYFKNKIIKLGLWCAVPLGWHAIFLTGSMGGFLGLGMTTFFIAFRSKRKILMVGIPIVLAVAFITQGGSYLKNKAAQEDDPTKVSTADQRKHAWGVGIKIMMRHPLTGAGLGNFAKAYPDFSDTQPHIAHNTFFQFGGESGAVAAFLYVAIIFNVFYSYIKQRKLDNTDIDPLLLAVKESVTGGILGFSICASFLNLGNYEILYFLLIVQSLRNKLTYEYVKNFKRRRMEAKQVQRQKGINNIEQPVPT